MKAGMRQIKGNATKRLKDMAARANDFETFWLKSLRPLYRKYQENRWMSGNDGEWKPVSFAYALWKFNHREVNRMGRKYGMKGGGAELMLASGLLAESITLKTHDFAREAVTDHGVDVFTSLSYAKYADKARTFTTFSKEFKDKIRKRVQKFIARGDLSQ